MGKDIKEKYERVCAIKDRAIGIVEGQINGDISSVDAKELGEVADIAKDMAEVMKLCAESEYYHKITEAMDKNSDEYNKMYMDKYLPETAMYYTPMGMTTYARRRDSRGRYMYTEPAVNKMYPYMPDYDGDFRDRMYYSSMGGNSNGGSSSGMSSGGRTSNFDSYGTRSYITRRTYIDMKDSDKSSKIEKLKEYVDDFSNEMQEMFVEGKATSEEKNVVKQALAQFINKL